MADKLAIDGGTPVRTEFLVYGKPKLEAAEIDEVVATLKSGWLSTGPKVAKFETEFAKYTGAKHAIAVAHCTGALHLALVAAGIGPGDEVITTTLTFVATAEAIQYVGATPVFADVDPVSLNLDPEQVKKKITSKTTALIPVHYAGNPCPMDELLAIARQHNLKVIVDAAHAVETTYRGTHVARIGDLVCFSFYATKNLAVGEGGMITTDNDDYAEQLQILRLHGMSRDAWKRYSTAGFKPYEIVRQGYKYNLTDIAAAIGIHQLARLDANLKYRTGLAERYTRLLAGMPELTTLPASTLGKAGWHLYVIRLRLDRLTIDRDQFVDALQKEGIGVGVHFVALHLHPYYRETYGYRPGDFPVAAAASREIISLPLAVGMTEADVDDAVAAVKKIVAARRK